MTSLLIRFHDRGDVPATQLIPESHRHTKVFVAAAYNTFNIFLGDFFSFVQYNYNTLE